MIFVTIEEVDTILGTTWAAQEKKSAAVQDANDWLNGMKLCKGLEPIADPIKRAGAYLSRLSSQDLLYATQTDGVVTEKTVSAQQGTSVSKKYAVGQEKGKHADMQRVESLLKPYLCSGVGSINGWVCK